MRLRYAALFASYLLLMASIVAFLVLRSSRHDSTLVWDDEVRQEVQWIVDQRYVEPIDAELDHELFDAAMRGYVGRLDAFSRYFTPEERRALDQDTTGSFGGIGVQVHAVEGGLFVSAVYRGGPAATAGVRPADVIEEVAGQALVGLDRDAMIDLIKGEPDTPVSMTLRRDETERVQLEVIRGIVGLDTVPAVRFFPGDLAIGYLRVSQFSETTGAEVNEALEDLVDRRGAEALVLDLRQNLGGVVNAAVDVAAFVLQPETVVCVTRGRDRLEQYVTPPNPTRKPLDLPLVVLVDDSSASASEILAGALQDHGRAVLVGERTYGKFLVQSLIRLASSEGVVRITTSRYETPRGRSAQRDHTNGVRGGLFPDARVRMETVAEAEELLLQFARQSGPEWETIPGRDADVLARIDPQLQAALDLLRDGAAPSERVAPRAN